MLGLLLVPPEQLQVGCILTGHGPLIDQRHGWGKHTAGCCLNQGMWGMFMVWRLPHVLLLCPLLLVQGHAAVPMTNTSLLLCVPCTVSPLLPCAPS